MVLRRATINFSIISHLIGIPIELECTASSLKASFNTADLNAQLLPYSIKFLGNHTCESVNANSTDHIKDGKIWIATNYTDCGTKAYHEGDQIAFEQTILIEYGSQSGSLVYRYFNSSYDVKCVLDRNVAANLSINVEHRNTIGNSRLSLKYIIYNLYQTFLAGQFSKLKIKVFLSEGF